MRRPKLRTVDYEFDWEDGTTPDKFRTPYMGFGWNSFCAAYGELDRTRAQELMVPLVWAYNEGRYEDALGYLQAVIEAHPDAERELGIYSWTCRRVLAVELDQTDLAAREAEERWTRRGFLRYLTARPKLMVRCKWCGRLSEYISPNGDYGGFNSCRRCGGEYPAPDFGWDSMEGMAYCAGRGSWGERSLPERLWNEYFDDYERRFHRKTEEAR